MIMETPDVLALDFDGVLCDGLVEYFQTAWHTYTQIWGIAAEPGGTPIQVGRSPKAMGEMFFRLRPVIEIGWEMPVLIRAIALGMEEYQILQNWPEIRASILETDRLNSAEIMAAVDHYRDQWIGSDLSGWLAGHRFYPGVVNQLQSLLASPIEIVIITTKEARFVQELCHREAIALNPHQIIGKGIKRPKAETLLALNPLERRIWFIEDRLNTLLNVAQHPQLTSVELFFATWGYNTPTEQAQASHHSRLHLLSLDTFVQPLSYWIHA